MGVVVDNVSSLPSVSGSNICTWSGAVPTSPVWQFWVLMLPLYGGLSNGGRDVLQSGVVVAIVTDRNEPDDVAGELIVTRVELT